MTFDLSKKKIMKPLIVLLISFIIASIVITYTKKSYDFSLSARIAMAVMLSFTAIGHFIFTKGMALMLPGIFPLKTFIIHLSGILELVIAIGLLVPRFKTISGWALIILLILILPANINAAIHQINYQKGSFDGPGLSYLWFRIPLQVFFIIWTFLSSITSFKV